MKSLSIVLTIVVAICLLLVPAAIGQSEGRNIREHFRGSVVAYDGFASLSNLTSAPNSFSLVVKVESHKRSEPLRYVLVIYEYFDLDDKRLSVLTSGLNSKWGFKATRDTGCDRTVGKLKFGESISLDGKEKTKFLRLKMTQEFGALPETLELRCYVVTEDGLRIVK